MASATLDHDLPIFIIDGSEFNPNVTGDACGDIDVTNISQTVYDCDNLGAFITYTATDESGNSCDGSGRIILSVAYSCAPFDTTIMLEEGESVTFTPQELNANPAVCPDAINLALSQETFTTADAGVNNVILEKNFSDGFHYCPVTVTILTECSCDDEAPVFDFLPSPIDNIACGDSFPSIETLTATDNGCPFVDNIPPVISNCSDVIIPSPDCLTGTFSYDVMATDNLDSELAYTIEIDVAMDGNNEATFAGTGNMASVSYVFPIGTSLITITFTDDAGNVAVCDMLVTVVLDPKPAAICIGEQSASLSPMDLDGDGVIDGQFVVLTPANFDAGGYDPCGLDLNLSFSPNTNDTSLIYDCGDLGINTIELWYTNSIGKQNYCSTTIEIQDNNDLIVQCFKLFPQINDDISLSVTVLAEDYVEAQNNCSTIDGDLVFSFDRNNMSDTTIIWYCDDVNIIHENKIYWFDMFGVLLDSCSALTTPLDPFDLCANNPLQSDGDINYLAKVERIALGDNTNYRSSQSLGGCYSLVHASLNNPTDSDGDGLIDLGSIDVDASVFCISEADSVITSFSMDTSMTSKVFDCGNLGLQNVVVYSTYPDGSQDSCETIMEIQDNCGFCLSTKPIATIETSPGSVNSISVEGTMGLPYSVPVTSTVDPFVEDLCNGFDVTYRWTAVDSCGNTEQVTRIFSVSPDTIGPEFICLSPTFALDPNTGVVVIEPYMLIDSLVDDCSGVDSTMVIASQTTFFCNDVGVQSITVIATDSCGNQTSCESMVTIQDKNNPVVVCAISYVVSDIDDGMLDCSHTESSLVLDPIVIDNCPDNVMHDYSVLGDPGYTGTNDGSTLQGAVFPLGVTSITWTVSDISGNTSECFTMVTVIDNTPPVCIKQDTVFINLDSIGMYSFGESDLSSLLVDNCDDMNLTYLFNPFTVNCDMAGHTITVAFSAVDLSGNLSNACPLVVVINDIKPQCNPIDITLSLDQTGTATIVPADVSTLGMNVCGVMQTASINPSSFDCDDIGDNIVTITVSAGNSSTTCEANVSVVDELGPEIICANDTNIRCEELQNLYNGDPIAWINAIPNAISYSDNCPSILLIDTVVVQSPNPCGWGVTTRTTTVTDSYNNSSQCTQTLTIDTPIKLVTQSDIDGLNLPMNVTVFGCIQDSLNFIPNNTNIGQITSDSISVISACSQVEITYSDVAMEIVTGCNTILERTWFILEVCQEDTFTYTQNIHITDTLPPTTICISNEIIFLNEFGEANLTPEQIDDGSFDNCSNVTLSIDRENFFCNDGFTTNFVQLTATDKCGNQDVCIAAISVRDTIAPVCIGNTKIQIQLGPGQCDGIAVFDPPVFEDNCPTSLIVVPIGGQLMSGDIFPIGTTLLTYIGTDAFGNSATCTQTIEILEFTPPGLACTNINFSLDTNCEGRITPDMILSDTMTIGCMDNCTITLYDHHDNIISTNGEVDASHIGMTLKAEVCCGGICCWSYAHIENKLPPVISCTTSYETCHNIMPIDADILYDVVEGVNVISGCGDMIFQLINESSEDISCTDPTFKEKRIRRWVAIDQNGLISEPCEQVVYVAKLFPSLISFPNRIDLECTEEYLTDLDPKESGLGVPVYVHNGDSIILYPTPVNSCNIQVSYKDKVLIDNGCKKKITRTWNFLQWHCGTPDDIDYVQLIEIGDHVPPVISVPDLNVTTDGHGCDVEIGTDHVDVWDNCSEFEFDIQMSSSTSLPVPFNPGHITLPVGQHEILYTVTDACGNRIDTIALINVLDKIAPVAICDEHLVVGIALDTTVAIFAEALDEGSYDDCGEVTLRAARSDGPRDEFGLMYHHKVHFYCSDTGKEVDVMLEVTDESGNKNYCWTKVFVQDKVDPRIQCPPDMEMECDAGFDPDNLSGFFGNYQIFDNCAGEYTVADEIMEFDSICGGGKVYRKISLLSLEGDTLDYCLQIIRFAPGTAFTGDYTDWPPKEFTYEGCGVEFVPVDTTGRPVINHTSCQLAGMRYEDQYFDITEEGSCGKIIRTWTVIDWCSYDNPWIDSEWNYEQIIKIINTDKPEFSSLFADSTFCSFDANCDSLQIDGYLLATAMDSCTATDELYYSYEVYSKSYDKFVTGGHGLDASGKYALGSYEVRYLVEDRCGNLTLETSTFVVENCKSPTPYCLNGLSAALVPMDLDSNGVLETEMVMLTPDFFDAGSWHACSESVTLSFSGDIYDTLLIYGCDDIGLKEIELWVTSSSGNQDYCETFVDIQDNNNVNLCNDNRIQVTGFINTVENIGVEQVKVDLMAMETSFDITDQEGGYIFNDIHAENDYTLAPYKNDDHKNGVNTLDLVLIQRHILSLQSFDNPYDYIAADINHDESIKASDLLALRKVILGVSTDFPNNTSWRFFDKIYDFDQIENPLQDQLPEHYILENASSDMLIDFLGIKIGDIDGSVEPTSILRTKVHGSRSLSYQPLNFKVKPLSGNKYEIVFTVPNHQTWNGLQMALNIETEKILNIKKGVLDILSDLIISENEIRISHSIPHGVELKPGSELFSIEITKGAETQLSKIVSLNNKSLIAEAYTGNSLETKELLLNWKDNKVMQDMEVEFVVNQNYPNPWMSSTNIEFNIPEKDKVVLHVFNVHGHLVYSEEKVYNPGINMIKLNDNNLSLGGIYFYDIKYKDQLKRNKMILIK